MLCTASTPIPAARFAGLWTAHHGVVLAYARRRASAALAEEVVGGGAHPRALDADPAAPEGDLAGLVAVAHGSSLGVMAALGADDLCDLLFHQLGEDAQAEADRQGQKALLGDAHQLPERLLHA